MKKTLIVSIALATIFGLNAVSYAKDDKARSLPPGLQKKAERGQSLPPGWQKKLIVGDILDSDIYRHGKIVTTDDNGLVTISVEGRLIKLVQNTREIVEILDEM